MESTKKESGNSKEKQTIDFDICKRNLLLKLQKELDKSKKGSVDEPIVDLVNYINKTKDYCTTSSCSGRFAIFCADYDESKGEQISKGGKWLFVEHRIVTSEELISTTLQELPNCKGVTLFKLEPFVLHVQCRDWESAQTMLTLAIAAGFRESGILMGRRIMLGIRTTANSMEFPIAENGQLLVSKEYLEYVIHYGNKKFEDNLRRIAVFFNSVQQSFPIVEEESNIQIFCFFSEAMSFTIHTHSPGKIILLGEHSVVYNRTALCGVVDSCRIHCYGKETEQKRISITSKSIFHSAVDSIEIHSNKVSDLFNQLLSCPLDVESFYTHNIYPILYDQHEISYLSKSIAIVVCYLYSIISKKFSKDIGIDLVIDNQGIPEKKGIGGSAALCTSIASCLLLLFYQDSSLFHSSKFLDEINELAYQGEVLFHGKPSGLDNSVSCYGGLIQFQKNQDGQFELIPIQSSSLSFLLIDSLLPKNTAAMIQNVAQQRSLFPQAINCIFDSIHNLVLSLIDENHQLNESLLPNAIKINHDLLCALGVSCSELDQIVQIANKYDYSAKLTGGGGGGCAIAVSRGNSDSKKEQLLINELTNAGFQVQHICIGGKGLQMEICK